MSEHHFIPGKRQNNEAYRIYQGVVLPYFGLMGYVSS
jgi:hypothetical protein